MPEREEPFTDAEPERIRALVGDRTDGILLQLGGPNQRARKRLADAPSIDAFVESYPLDVSDPTDPRPFFFDRGRLAGPGRTGEDGYTYAACPVTILLSTLLVRALLCVFVLVLPLRFVRSVRRPTVGSLPYFGAVGLGSSLTTRAPARILCADLALATAFIVAADDPTGGLACSLRVCAG